MLYLWVDDYSLVHLWYSLSHRLGSYFSLAQSGGGFSVLVTCPRVLPVKEGWQLCLMQRNSARVSENDNHKELAVTT
jgi:hypothetical protein